MVAVVNLGQLRACPVIQQCHAAEEASMPRLRSQPLEPRGDRRDVPGGQRPDHDGRAIPQNHPVLMDPAAPAGPAVVATAGGISVIIAHPLIPRGTSAAFTVALAAAPAQGRTSRHIRTFGRCGQPGLHPARDGPITTRVVQWP